MSCTWLFPIWDCSQFFGNWSGVGVILYSCWALEYLTTFSAVWNLHQHQYVDRGWQSGHSVLTRDAYATSSSEMQCLVHSVTFYSSTCTFGCWLLLVYLTCHLAWLHSKFGAHRRELRGKQSCKADPGLCNIGVWVTKSHQPPSRKVTD